MARRRPDADGLERRRLPSTPAVAPLAAHLAALRASDPAPAPGTPVPIGPVAPTGGTGPAPPPGTGTPPIAPPSIPSGPVEPAKR
jgi:hypothetical protein